MTAVLQWRSKRILDAVTQHMDETSDQPVGRILAIFDMTQTSASKELSSPQGFNGCMFLKTIHEFRAPETLAHQTALQHKKRIIALFEHELAATTAEDPAGLALSLHLLLDGAISQTQLLADRNSIKRARHLAKGLLSDLS